uniref:Uncharacterized protein n=1 Tax=Rhizophora mucronata TaxID=61149 RepID=A0A2P2QVE6_RHIMU
MEQNTCICSVCQAVKIVTLAV